MNLAALLVSMIACGPAPTTLPTTNPAGFDAAITRARGEIASAERTLARVSDECRVRAEQSAEYLGLKAELQAKQAAYDAAKADGSVQERLETGGQVNTFRERMKKLASNALKADSEIAKSSVALQKARERLERAETERAEFIDELRREHKVFKGMSMEQVVEVLGEPTEIEREARKAAGVWEIYETRPDTSSGGYRATETRLGSMDLTNPNNQSSGTRQVLVKVIFVNFIDDIAVRVSEREHKQK